MTPRFQQFYRLLGEIFVIIFLCPFCIPAAIPRYRLTERIKYFDDPPLVLFRGSIHRLSLLFADSSAGCFCLLTQPEHISILQTGKFCENFFILFFGRVQKEKLLYPTAHLQTPFNAEKRADPPQGGPARLARFTCLVMRSFLFRNFKRFHNSRKPHTLAVSAGGCGSSRRIIAAEPVPYTLIFDGCLPFPAFAVVVDAKHLVIGGRSVVSQTPAD